MDFRKYQQLAGRTANGKPGDDLLVNFALGITGEAGEVADIVKKYRFHGHPLNREDLIGELGDVLWYVSQIAQLAAIGLDEIAESNIAKLMKRYPNGFSEEDSLKRRDVKNLGG
ncbi:nucleoside triphosphate pyrophosphohydrolase family protein [Bacillaceae bacterium Marseille-Q3522]|nr:nucleoside triphosphate pyrophosphohydrolase family protein [Bacillaceae bacterium Marseille-Q3522]